MNRKHSLIVVVIALAAALLVAVSTVLAYGTTSRSTGPGTPLSTADLSLTAQASSDPLKALPLAGDHPGIECSCTLTGTYLSPDGVEPQIASDGTSPHLTYTLVVTKVNATDYHITIRQGTYIKLNESFAATAWGFSPNDDAFVIHGLNAGIHEKWLYNLNPDPSQEDELAQQIWHDSVSTGSSGLFFSPHGRYLLYAALMNTNKLYLRVVNTADGQVAYAPVNTSLYGSLTDQTAGWGFSSDKGDASFLYTYLIDATHYNLHVINLSTGEPILEKFSSSGMAHWSFSPCGDVLSFWDDPYSTLSLYKTTANNVLLGSRYGAGFAHMASNLDNHVAYYQSDPPQNMAENTADIPCSDTEPPTWPQGSSLTATHVTSTQLQLCWSEAQDNVGVTTYAVYTDSVLISTITGTVTSTTVTELIPAVEYHFRIEARDAAGNQSIDGPVLTVTTPSNVPTWPLGSELVAGDIGLNSLTLTWTAAIYPDGVTSYQIYAGAQLLRTVSGNVLSTTLSSLSPNTIYTFTVQACYQSNCSTDGPSAQVTTAGDVLALELSDEPEPVQVGFYWSYQAHVTNHRRAGASNVIVTVALPAQADLFSVTPTRGSCGTSGKTITCTLGALLWEQRAVVSIVMRATQLGKLTVMANVTAQENDPVPENNTAEEITLVNNWRITKLEEGVRSAIALDSQGKIHLAYLRYYSDNYELHYATNASGIWTIQRLAQATQLDTCAITLDAAGNVHIGYVESDPATFGSRVKHVSQVGGSWQSATILWENNEGFWPLSMAFDRLGNLHLSYIATAGAARSGQLYHLKVTSTDVVSEAIGQDLEAYDYAAMAVDSQNRLHLSYYFGGLNYYITQDNDGLWQPPQEVDTVGGQREGMVTDLVVDSADIPHISYVGGSLEDHRYASLTSSGWVTHTIDPGGFASAGNAIALGPDKSVHLSYFHWRSHELRYATNSSGTWVTETVDIGETSDWDSQNHIGVNPDGLPLICYRNPLSFSYNSPTYCALRQPVPDSDPDGVPDVEERGPDGNEIDYDGNDDGLSDSQEANVASLHTVDGEHYVTLAAPEDVILANVQPLYDAAPGDVPSDASFPYRFLSFTLFNVQAGAEVSVTLYLPPGETVSTYYKYGRTPDNPNDHWYEFLYDGTTGAVIHGNVITLYFVDGLRGDNDLIPDGQVSDPGAPATSTYAIYLPIIIKNWGAGD